MNLKINLLSPNLVAPKKNKVLNVVIDMKGVEKINLERLKFMADTFMNHPEATRILVNCNEELKEQLEVFRRIHTVIFKD